MSSLLASFSTGHIKRKVNPCCAADYLPAGCYKMQPKQVQKTCTYMLRVSLPLMLLSLWGLTEKPSVFTLWLQHPAQCLLELLPSLSSLTPYCCTYRRRGGFGPKVTQSLRAEEQESGVLCNPTHTRLLGRETDTPQPGSQPTGSSRWMSSIRPRPMWGQAARPSCFAPPSSAGKQLPRGSQHQLADGGDRGKGK